VDSPTKWHSQREIPCLMPYNDRIDTKHMTTKLKRICVSPVSRKAKNRFANEMDSFHTCTVESTRELGGKEWMFLKSLNGNYFFWVPEGGSMDWKIEK